MGKKHVCIFLAVLQKNERGKTKNDNFYISKFNIFIHINNCTATLPTLTRFPHPSGKISIMQEVVPQYKQLGNILLQDPNGVKVMAIEMNHGRVDNVVHEIFQRWLIESVDATWGKLVQCLEDVDLSPLAVKINSCLSETQKKERGKTKNDTFLHFKVQYIYSY